MLPWCTTTKQLQAPERIVTLSRDERIRSTAFSPAAFVHRVQDGSNNNRPKQGKTPNITMDFQGEMSMIKLLVGVFR